MHVNLVIVFCPVFSFCVFLLGFSLSLSLLTSTPCFQQFLASLSLILPHTHTHTHTRIHAHQHRQWVLSSSLAFCSFVVFFHFHSLCLCLSISQRTVFHPRYCTSSMCVCVRARARVCVWDTDHGRCCTRTRSWHLKWLALTDTFWMPRHLLLMT